MLIDEQKIGIHGIKIKKKNGVRFNFSSDTVNEYLNTPILKKQITQPKFRNLTRTTPYKTRQSKKFSTTQRIHVRKSNIQDNQLKIALDDIQQRGSTFYKLGFLSIEKKGKKRKLFGEYFNLRHQQMKGTLSIGQMWSNKQRANFLKQNKLHVNKVKLVQKIQCFKQQNDFMAKKLQSQNTLASSTSNCTHSEFATTKSLFSEKSHNTHGKQNAQKNLTTLRKKLAFLHKDVKKQQIKDMFKNLEFNNEKMGKLQEKYFLKLIQML